MCLRLFNLRVTTDQRQYLVFRDDGLTLQAGSWHKLSAQVGINKLTRKNRKLLTFGEDEVDGHKDQISAHPQPLAKVLVRPGPLEQTTVLAYAAK
jgi:hypothetical protein